MSESEVTTIDETAPFEESVHTSPILDPATVTSPADCGLNLLTDVPAAVSKKTRTHRSSTAPAKANPPGSTGLLRSRKVRMLLILASLLLIVGLIGWNANRLPAVNDSEELDVSEIGESVADTMASDSLAEPQRHAFDAQFEDHPLLRNTAQTRITSDWSAESDFPASDSSSSIVPSANFNEGPLPPAATPQRRAPATGVHGAWLTGQIEPDDSPVPPATIQRSSANQSAPRLLRNGTRHPLAD